MRTPWLGFGGGFPDITGTRAAGIREGSGWPVGCSVMPRIRLLEKRGKQEMNNMQKRKGAVMQQI